jgi:hypothetical protein
MRQIPQTELASDFETALSRRTHLQLNVTLYAFVETSQGLHDKINLFTAATQRGLINKAMICA